MSPIVRSADLVSMRKAWRRVFSSIDPFGIPFSSRISSMMILYPTDGYYLSRLQLKAIREASQDIGEKEFFLSVVEYDRDFVEVGWHWECRHLSYEEYRELPIILENAIYSPQSTWGLLISHEDHAIVGGEEQFIDALRRAYPDWESDLQKLEEAWGANPNRGWLDEVLSEVRHCATDKPGKSEFPEDLVGR